MKIIFLTADGVITSGSAESAQTVDRMKVERLADVVKQTKASVILVPAKPQDITKPLPAFKEERHMRRIKEALYQHNIGVREVLHTRYISAVDIGAWILSHNKKLESYVIVSCEDYKRENHGKLLNSMIEGHYIQTMREIGLTMEGCRRMVDILGTGE